MASQRPDPLVLVADDDRDVLGIVETRLRRANYEVLTASDGEQALAIALDRRPEIAILDVIMPHRTGHEVTREIRSNGTTEGMQVILLSARDRHHDIVRGFEAGADDYVTKPFKGRDLDLHVDAAWERLAQLSGLDPVELRDGDPELSGPSAETQMRDLLLAAIGEREGDLHGHVHDVAQYAVPVGRRLGLSRDELRTLAYAAHLHDVGKLGIPDRVLEKPGTLSQAEWRLMRKHTLIGERILRAAPSMAEIGKIVRSCHERWDGTGYPDGLAGDDIPLASRLIFVCDAFSAMTSRRVYSEPRKPIEALGELMDCAGTHFDPVVVDAFIAEAVDAGWDRP